MVYYVLILAVGQKGREWIITKYKAKYKIPPEVMKIIV